MHPEISDDADSDSTKQGCGFHDPRTVLVPQGRIRDPEAHHCDRNAGPQHSKSRPYNRTPIDTPQTPVHHGYTSGVGLVMWPMYGFFVCLLHEAIHVSPRLAFLDGDVQRAVLVALDAMVLEVAANAFTLLGFGSYFFHYHAGDLVHFTTWEIFVPYVVAGALGLQLLKVLERRAPKVPTGVVLFAVGVLSVLLQPPA